MNRDESRIRVLLADDHVLVRTGLKHLIDSQPDMAVVAEASNGQEALRLAQSESPHVALLDVSMAGWDGVTLARELSRTCPRVKIIAVTRHDDGAFLRRMLQEGASGYVLKQNVTHNLATAVRTCVGGAQYIDTGVRSVTPSRDTSSSPQRAAVDHGDAVTHEEQEVLRLVASAVSTQRIAEQLGILPDVVEHVKQRAMRKLGLTTRMQVFTYMRSRLGTDSG